MSMSDTIGDLLTRIRNASKNRAPKLTCPHSKQRKNVLEALQREGYIGESTVREIRKGVSVIDVELRYHEGQPVIYEIKRVSKPGLRVYRSINSINAPNNGLGVYILSTQKGVLSDHEARSQNVGGEIICSVF